MVPLRSGCISVMFCALQRHKCPLCKTPFSLIKTMLMCLCEVKNLHDSTACWYVLHSSLCLYVHGFGSGFLHLQYQFMYQAGYNVCCCVVFYLHLSELSLCNSCASLNKWRGHREACSQPLRVIPIQQKHMWSWEMWYFLKFPMACECSSGCQ